MTVRRLFAPVFAPALLAWERAESGVAFHPRSKAATADPYPLYARMREIDPVHRMRLADGWVVTRYEDVDTVLQDHGRFSSALHQKVAIPYHARTVSPLNLDPPAHTRVRSLASGPFTQSAVDGLRPRVQALADRLLDDLAGKPRFDLISSIAHPLPVMVMAEMLGIPAEDVDRFERWSDMLVSSVDPFMTHAEQRRADRARTELSAYFDTVVDLRRADPRDDIISVLLQAREEGDRLSREELRGVLNILLVAGNETTKNLIGNGMLALLRHPGQARRLREDPSLISTAVQELLRFDAPVQIDSRTAVRDVEIGGRRVLAGEKILTVIGAANRDPDVFPDADELDLTRNGAPHLSFGSGIHRCLGGPLADVEAEVAFTSILERYPSMRLVAEPPRAVNAVLRGAKEIWVDVL